MNLPAIRLFPALSLLFFLCLFPVAPAAPEISGVSLRYCGSLRIPENGWAYLYYDLKNPDAQPVNLKLVLKPEGQVNITIYEHQLTLPAKSRFKSRVPVTIGKVQSYTASLYADGHLIDDDELLLSVPAREQEKRLEREAASSGRQLSELEKGIALGNERFVFFANDNLELSYGTFAKNEALNHKYLTSTIRQRDIPEHYAQYGDAHMVVLQQPAFARWTNRQVKALLDFVAHGGSVLFAGPHGLMDAYQHTMLRRLVSVEPLRVRKLEQLDALQAIGGSSLEWESGIDFLESVPNGAGIDTLSHDGFPLLRWSRYGLGYVGVCAIDPSDPSIQGTANFGALWNHIFTFGGNNSLTTSRGDVNIAQALDTITGVAIPRAQQIQLFLLGYLVLVVLLIGGGMATRMRMQAWIGLGIIAIITTVFIFHFANRRAASLSTHTASILDFQVEGAHDTTGEELISLFLKREEVLTLRSPSVDSEIRSLLPPPQRPVDNTYQANWASEAANTNEADAALATTNPIVSRGGASEAIRDPLRITLRDGHSILDQLTVKRQMPRFYGVLYSGTASPDWQPPVVTWQINGPLMDRWPVPAGIPASEAFFVCETGYYAVTLRDGYCSLTSETQNASFREASKEIVFLRSYLGEQKLPSPMLVLIGESARDSSGILPENFEILGRRISMIPVLEQRIEERAAIPFRRISVETGRLSRLLRLKNQWQADSTLKGNDTKDYDFIACLPPGYNRMSLDTVRIRFVADNRGKNLQFALYLVDPNAPEGEDLIKFTSQEDGVYTFTNLAGRLLDPAGGRFRFVVRASTIQPVVDPNVAARMNTWLVRELDLAAEGILPPETRGRL